MAFASLDVFLASLHSSGTSQASEEKKGFVRVNCSTKNEAKALPETDLWSSIPGRVGQNLTVEAAGGADDTIRFVSDDRSSGVLQAFHKAYADHFPLALTPDDIWLCVAQAFAQHVNKDPEAMRSMFVSHEGKKTIRIHIDTFTKGSRTNPWPEVFSEFRTQMTNYVKGDVCDVMKADFSTTTQTSAAVADVTLMDSMQAFFDFRCRTRCGIPEIHVYGTPADWASVRAKAAALAKYGLEFWIPTLDSVLAHFQSVAEGKAPDMTFWEAAYKRRGGSGGPYVSGWINVLYPYTGRGRKNTYATSWPAQRTGRGAGMCTDDFPSSMSAAPVIWEYLSQEFNMKFLGGFMGVGQRTDTLAITPYLGWAVAEEK